jgi:heme A synthase
MDFIFTLHRGLTNMAVLYFLVLGVWGMFRAVRGRDVNGSYLGALVVAQVLLVANVIIGGVLWLDGRSATMVRFDVHALYGGFVLVFLPFVYAVLLRGDDSNRGQWVWGFVNLFMFFLVPRFFITGL